VPHKSFGSLPPVIPPPPISGFPNVTNTGVPTGTSLTVVNGDITTSSNGQVFDALDVRGMILVQHADVTIKRCKVYSVIDINPFYGDNRALAARLLVYDCTIGPPVAAKGNQGITTGSFDCQFLRNNISNCEHGVWQEGNGGLIQDNYLHDFIPYNPVTDPHIDGLQIPFGPTGSPTPYISNCIMRHNNVDLTPSGQPSYVSASITMKDAGSITIDNNRLNGGSYVVYFNGTTSGCTVTNNRFGAFQFGYVDGDSPNVQSYSGNVVDSTGQPLSLP